jgi:hypothetical protein
LGSELFDDAEQNKNIKSKKQFLTSASIPWSPHETSLNGLEIISVDVKILRNIV